LQGRHASNLGSGISADPRGPPAEQERVGTLVELADERHGLAVEQRPSPSAALEPAPEVLFFPPAVSRITPSTDTCVW
jgi:hypothetical protein